MPQFHTHIVVDGSARSSRSPRKPSKDAIWWCVAQIDGPCVKVREPEYKRTRHEAIRCLVRLMEVELNAGRRVLAGLDFPFGYPASVAQRLTGTASALSLWDWLAKRIEDKPDYRNNRYDVAARINDAYPGIGPCWGRPRHWDYPSIPVQKSEVAGQECHPRERRVADQGAKGAETVWQLAYAGAVGSQVLLGLPALKRLIQDRDIAGRAKIWPFETGLRVPESQAVIVEVYPSLLKKQIDARKAIGEIPDRAQVRVLAEAFARLDAGGCLAPLFIGSSCLTPKQRRHVEKEEGWILGLNHEEALGRAMRAP